MGVVSALHGHIDSVFEALSGAVGTPPDQLKLIFILLISIPLALPAARLPASSNLTHIYSLTLSWIFHTQILHLSSGFYQLLGQSIATYYVAAYCHTTRKPKPWYWAIFAANMGLLTVNHFARWITNTPLDIVEITGSQMVLVMKLSLFAWACYDGTRPVEQLDSVQKRDRLSELPGLLPFLGYCFFFASVMAGPTFTFQSYAAYVDRSLFISVKGKERKVGIPSGRLRKAAKRLAISAFYLGVYAILAGRFDYTRIPERAHKGFVSNVMFMQACGFLARTKYYAAWGFAECGMIVSGLGYDPETGKWNRGRNVYIRQIEFAQSYKTLLDAWNCGTNYWLRECVYKRLARAGRKPGFKSTMVTFMTSAFWHGFNPTYYITFFLGGFIQALGRKIRTNIRPFMLPANYVIMSPENKVASEKTLIKQVYDVLSVLAVQVTLNFIVAPFIMLEIIPTFKAWSVVYYYGIPAIFIPYLLLQYVFSKPLRQMQIKRAKSAGVDEKAVEMQRRQAKKEADKGAHLLPNVHQAMKQGMAGSITDAETDNESSVVKSKGK